MDFRLWDEKEDARALSEEGVEVWAPVEGFPDYYISNLGRMMSNKKGRGRILRGSAVNTGYICFTFVKDKKRSSQTAQRAVLLAFGEKPGPEDTDARHKNSHKTDNRLFNLVWGTRSENMLDVWEKRRQGLPASTTDATPTPNATYTLDPKLVTLGLEFHKEGKLSISDLARLWDCTWEVAQAVVHGETWNHIERPEPPKKQLRRTKEEREQIIALIEEGKNLDEINEIIEHPLTHQGLYYYKKRGKKIASPEPRRRRRLLEETASCDGIRLRRSRRA
jgi:hypothetical protein